jgi:hypothetical protein
MGTRTPPGVTILYDPKTGKEVTLIDRKPTMSDEELIRLRKMGLSTNAIAEIANRAASTIQERLKHLGFTDRVEHFRSNKADILEQIQWRMIKQTTDKDLHDLVKKRGFVDLAIIEDKIRLIRGESTSNVKTLSIVVDNANERRKKRLGSLPDSEQQDPGDTQEAVIIEDDDVITTD